MNLSAYDDVIGIDFEFRPDANGRPIPVCCVVIEFRSGRKQRIWLEGQQLDYPPFRTGPGVLITAYFASAELNCFRVLDWTYPQNVIDLYAEFRVKTNGTSLPHGRGLLGALQYFGFDGMEVAEKESLRQRILVGPPFDAEERQTILDYCELDVCSLAQLFPRLVSDHENLLPALLRGEYMKSIASAEYAGVPIDKPLYDKMVDHWSELQANVIERVNADFPVFEDGHFRIARFESMLDREKIRDWPLTTTGELALDDDTFRDLTNRYPRLEPLRQVRQILGQLHRPSLTIGADGRNRCLLSPYSTKTGRNAPSTTKFILGTPSFTRGLIRPEPGKALAYIDWSSQEFGIGAALSGDAAMQEAYRSGDVYLAFAKYANAVPTDATEESHKRERNLFKKVILGTQYMIGADGLAYQLGILRQEAQALLDHHRRIFSRFWQWSDSVCDYGQLYGELKAAFGWRIDLSTTESIRTIRNWPMQANGAEMLRLACVLAFQAGVSVIAMLHDALLIEAYVSEIDHAVALTQKAMRRASELVLGGFRLRTGKKPQIIRPGGRFEEDRGQQMWGWITQCLECVK
jgi:hypothetical protein